MNKSNIRTVLIAVIFFYVLTAALAVIKFDSKSTLFSGDRMPDLTADLASTFGDKINNNQVDSTESTTIYIKYETETDASTKTDASTTREVIEITSTETIIVFEPLENDVTETTQDITEVATGEPNEIHYYTFVTTNVGTGLRMRKAPGDNTEIVTSLKPGTTGYVIEQGDEWSKVYANGKTGYCINKYLKLTEISKEEYDKLVKESEQESSEEE